MVGIDAAIANAFRRILLAEVHIWFAWQIMGHIHKAYLGVSPLNSVELTPEERMVRLVLICGISSQNPKIEDGYLLKNVFVWKKCN